MLLRKLSVYEKKAEKFDHESLLADMERDAERMKKDLDAVGQAVSQTIPFHKDDVTSKSQPQPQKFPMLELNNTVVANCDVKGYKPEELRVRTMGENLLEIIAERHEKNGLAESHTRFVRHVHMPAGVSISQITPNLTPDGQLIVTVPRRGNANHGSLHVLTKP